MHAMRRVIISVFLFIVAMVPFSVHAMHHTTHGNNQQVMRTDSMAIDTMVHDGNHVQAQPAFHGMYGTYSQHRDSTGTSWMPDSTHMPGIHYQYDPWLCMLHGYATAIYDHQGGCRGNHQIFSENMMMFTAQRDVGNAIVAFRSMVSLEPGTIGDCGYPLLLQTGETCNGCTPLIDRQHPHDLLMELAGVYTLTFSQKNSFFLYFGLPGEPALGPPVFIHRFSALYNPEAPLTHHWLDSTHTTFGVATVGFVHDWLKIDASVFTGREPDQFRWNFDTPRFDSQSVRLSVNPTRNTAAQISYAWIKSPELLHPCMNTQRATASCSYNKAWHVHNWQTTVAWGMNKNCPGNTLHGGLLESTISINNQHILFGRAECVAKDELFVAPDLRAEMVFTVGKLDLGYIFQFPLIPYTQWGVGFVVSASFVPDVIQHCYGGSPLSGMVFVRMDLKE